LNVRLLQCDNYHTAHRHFITATRQKAQLLGSWLKQWNFLEKGVIMSFYSKRPSDIATYHTVEGDLFYWNNIQELMEEL